MERPDAAASAGIFIKLLGEPELSRQGRRLKLAAPRATWSVLALLLLHPRGIDRAVVATSLWPQHADGKGRAVLRRHLHGLLASLPPEQRWIEGDARTMAWNWGAPFESDLLQFLDAIAAGRLAEAVDRYSGDLLGTSFHEGILVHRESLREKYVGALASSIAQSHQEGALEDAARYAELLLAADEWREDAVRLLMSARHRLGDRSGALAIYERFAAAVKREFGVPPTAETTALRDGIAAGQPWRPDAIALAPPARRFPLVGRAAELQSLKRAWWQAAHGRGSVLFVTGEAGIGKSTLVEELAGIVEPQGGAILVGRASESAASPYEPVVDALRKHVHHFAGIELEPVWRAVLAEAFPELSELSDRLALVPALDARAASMRLREAILKLIVAAAAKRPLVLVLEDLQWADAGTIELIGDLARRLAARPMLLVGTLRTEDLEAGGPLESLRRRLQREGRARSLPLGRLADQEIAKLVRDVLPGPLAGEASPEIRRLAAGHPLFAVQLLQYVLDTGERPSEDRVLATIGDTVVRRVSRLPDDARAIAELAAAMHGAFYVEELSRINGWSEARVHAAIGTLLDAKIVCELGEPDSLYGFSHALIEAAIRASLPQAERPARHARIAAVLEQTRKENPLCALVVATHWEAAGEERPAALAHARAARALVDRQARADAVAHARRALELGLSDDEAFETLALAVEATLALGQAAAESDHQMLGELSERLAPDRRFRALALRLTESIYHDPANAQGIAAQMLALSKESGRSDWRIEAEVGEARRLTTVGELVEAEAWLRSAVRLSKETAGFDVTCGILKSYFQIAAWLGLYEDMLPEIAFLECELNERGNRRAMLPLLSAYVSLSITGNFSNPEYLEKAERYASLLAEADGDVCTQLIAQHDLAMGAHIRWNSARSRAQLREVMLRAGELGIPQLASSATVRLARVERELGHFDRALALLEQSRGDAVRLKNASFSAEVAITFASVHLLAGNPQEALREAEAAFAFAGEDPGGSPAGISEALSTLGAAQVASGAVAEGMKTLQAGLKIQRTLKLPRALANELCVWLECRLHAGETAGIREDFEELFELFTARPRDQRYPGWIALTLSKAALTLGDGKRARQVAEAGRAAIRYVCSRLTEDADRDAFLNLSHNRELLAHRDP